MNILQMFSYPFMQRALIAGVLVSLCAAKMTTGMEKYNGVTPSATAMASAPKETWLRPSPIMEYRFRTSGTPNRAAHRLTSTPAIKALCIKG